MKLWQTRLHWDKFARTDPLWAIMSSPDKTGNRWQLDEFFATGKTEIAAVLERVTALQPSLPRRRALDFGCGVGRLTQALAAHFDAVTGVDISTEMLGLARRHSRAGERVTYVHNTRPDLAGFADASFDLVCSLITLQHIPPAPARRYLAEFIRVLAPGGVAVFQLPARLAGPARPRFSLWPATLARRAARALNRLTVREPYMAMHAFPRTEVEALLRAAGAEVLDVAPHVAGGDVLESLRYIARKPHP